MATCAVTCALTCSVTCHLLASLAQPCSHLRNYPCIHLHPARLVRVCYEAFILENPVYILFKTAKYINMIVIILKGRTDCGAHVQIRYNNRNQTINKRMSAKITRTGVQRRLKLHWGLSGERSKLHSPSPGLACNLSMNGSATDLLQLEGYRRHRSILRV